MNIFREYATSTAFAITLTKNQALTLLWLGNITDEPDYKSNPAGSRFVGAVQQLGTRGLVSHHYEKGCQHCDAHDGGVGHHYQLTRAGELMVDLLKEAEFSGEDG